MKNYKEVVGIDVSKKTIDAYCHQAHTHKEFKNEISGYKSLLKYELEFPTRKDEDADKGIRSLNVRIPSGIFFKR